SRLPLPDRAQRGLMVKALLIAALSMAASAGSTPLLGRWAGGEIGMKVTAEGALISFDCASVRIAHPIELDHGGKFTAEARSARYRPGPQPADQPTPDTVSRVSGVLRGDELTLTLSEPGRAPAIYVLHRNARVKLVRCL